MLNVIVDYAQMMRIMKLNDAVIFVYWNRLYTAGKLIALFGENAKCAGGLEFLDLYVIKRAAHINILYRESLVSQYHRDYYVDRFCLRIEKIPTPWLNRDTVIKPRV